MKSRVSNSDAIQQDGKHRRTKEDKKFSFECHPWVVPGETARLDEVISS